MGSIAADYIKVLPVGAAGAALFPAAAALADDTANPTTTLVGACIHGYDASNNQWERCRINADRILQVAAGTAATPTDTMANTELGGLYGPNGPGRALFAGMAQYSDVAGTWARARNYGGAHANIWSAASVTTMTGSANVFDAAFYRTVSVFGTSSVANVIRPQFSQDNTNYYTSNTISISTILMSAGVHHFAGTFDVGARYVRLLAEQSATITATIGAKGI